MAEERTFQIQLEGLIQLLAQNLYADPDVFLREMIQNAHDSITRRAELAAERGEPDPPSPRIQVVADPDAQQIRIHDNGSGLTRDEIDGYLSTIGRSGTDELRQRIAAADRTRTVELIGQFGIGLLSAFIVAERVTVVTKAAGHGALAWQSTGGRNYQVEPADRTQLGTTVTLQVSPAHSLARNLATSRRRIGFPRGGVHKVLAERRRRTAFAHPRPVSRHAIGECVERTRRPWHQRQRHQHAGENERPRQRRAAP